MAALKSELGNEVFYSFLQEYADRKPELDRDWRGFFLHPGRGYRCRQSELAGYLF